MNMLELKKLLFDEMGQFARGEQANGLRETYGPKPPQSGPVPGVEGEEGAEGELPPPDGEAPPVEGLPPDGDMGDGFPGDVPGEEAPPGGLEGLTEEELRRMLGKG